jgi:glycine betaine transporter
MGFKHILVPTDFSAPAKHALDLAIELAQQSGGKITILHAFMLPVTGYDELLTWPFEGLERATQRDLDKAVADARRKLDRVSGIVIPGAPWRVIADYAKEHDVDLIAMGTAGRGLVARALLGSVADKIVRVAHCPVLTTSEPASSS